MARPDTQARLAIEMLRKRLRHADHAAYRFPGERGLALGSDLSVCAVNNEGYGPYLIPPPTSLQAIPRARDLRKAARWLLTGEGWETPSLHRPADAPLFVGEPTQAAPRAERPNQGWDVACSARISDDSAISTGES